MCNNATMTLLIKTTTMEQTNNNDNSNNVNDDTGVRKVRVLSIAFMEVLSGRRVLEPLSMTCVSADPPHTWTSCVLCQTAGPVPALSAWGKVLRIHVKSRSSRTPKQPRLRGAKLPKGLS